MSLIPVKNTFPFKMIRKHSRYNNILYKFILYSELNLYNNDDLNHTILYTYWPKINKLYYWEKEMDAAELIYICNNLEDTKQKILEHYNKNKSL